MTATTTTEQKRTATGAANARAWQWTEQRERAAALLAADELSDEKIAKELGIGRTTLHEWKQHPEFAERVRENVAAIRMDVLRVPIAKKHERVAMLERLRQKMDRVIAKRAERYAADPDAPAEAGTGLMVRKHVTSAPDGVVGFDWTADVALLKEYRATLEQAAKELGQLVDKQEISGDTLVRRYVGVDVDAV